VLARLQVLQVSAFSGYDLCHTDTKTDLVILLAQPADSDKLRELPTAD